MVRRHVHHLIILMWAKTSRKVSEHSSNRHISEFKNIFGDNVTAPTIHLPNIENCISNIKIENAPRIRTWEYWVRMWLWCQFLPYVCMFYGWFGIIMSKTNSLNIQNDEKPEEVRVKLYPSIPLWYGNVAGGKLSNGISPVTQETAWKLCGG